MNHKTHIAIAVATLLAATSANSTFAQTSDQGWYVGVNANGVAPDRDFNAGNRAYGAGLRLGTSLNPDWDLQFDTSYTLARQNENRYRQNLLGANALIFLMRSDIRPFISFGAGAEFDKISSPLLRTDRSSLYASAGVGVKMALSEQWSAQLDWRKVHGYLRSNEFGFNQASNSYVTLGINYSFDKMPASKPLVRMAPAEPVAVEPRPAPVQETVAPVPVAPPPPAPRYERISLSATELFGFDSATLAPQQNKLDEIAAALNANQQVSHILITGYADRIGNAKYNLRLSEQRADSVKKYLSDKGVSTGRLEAQGKGEADPVVSCNDKKRSDLILCLEPNRRVEIEQFNFDRRVR